MEMYGNARLGYNVLTGETKLLMPISGSEMAGAPERKGSLAVEKAKAYTRIMKMGDERLSQSKILEIEAMVQLLEQKIHQSGPFEAMFDFGPHIGLVLNKVLTELRENESLPISKDNTLLQLLYVMDSNSQFSKGSNHLNKNFADQSSYGTAAFHRAREKGSFLNAENYANNLGLTILATAMGHTYGNCLPYDRILRELFFAIKNIPQIALSGMTLDDKIVRTSLDSRIITFPGNISKRKISKNLTTLSKEVIDGYQEIYAEMQKLCEFVSDPIYSECPSGVELEVGVYMLLRTPNPYENLDLDSIRNNPLDIDNVQILNGRPILCMAVTMNHQGDNRYGTQMSLEGVNSQLAFVSTRLTLPQLYHAIFKEYGFQITNTVVNPINGQIAFATLAEKI